LLSEIEKTRLRIARDIEKVKKSQLGQFFTPSRTASFMADMFPAAGGVCRLLDAGAGIGSLAAAFLERWSSGGFGFQQVEVDAFEIDNSLHSELANTLKLYSNPSLCVSVHGEDFIHAATDRLFCNLFSMSQPRYTHVILNPPYKKINSNSAHRLALRRIGIETVNLYSAFVALAVAQAAIGGQIVAIIPRSFCNGPYYKPFRDFILERSAIRHIHLFNSRSKAFKDDEVLQENIIIRMERGGQQGPVKISTSTDDTFEDLVIHEHPFNRIVFSDDPEQFIHIPTSTEMNAIELSGAIRCSLTDLGISVSTGPVVDFRLKEHLRSMPDSGTAPLLYPCHFSSVGTTWPIMGLKKANAIVCNADTKKWLYPVGFYCVVRRFSSKEEKRRIVASVVDPSIFNEVSGLGFENHLNLFHEKKRGLPEALAHGLAVFLNSTAVDENFRRFNGHTQVNVTDLKLIKYPNRGTLIELGEWAMRHKTLKQEQIDDKLGTLN
jgi:adenine-specific DNA-methyltransferase